jgi:hypothetical protein
MLLCEISWELTVMLMESDEQINVQVDVNIWLKQLLSIYIRDAFCGCACRVAYDVGYDELCNC